MEKNEIIEEKPKKNKKKGLIIMVILILLLVGVIIFIVPKIKEVGISGIFDSTKLNEEETKYYDLYVDALSKYKDGCDDGYKCIFQLHYFEKVDAPVIVIRKNKNGDALDINKTSIAYIKDDKVIINDYDDISRVEVMYNTEKDEIAYYLYEEDSNNHTKSYTLLKDIVTESTSPYTFTFTSKDKFNTTYKDSGEKVEISMPMALFVENLDNYQDTEKYYDQQFSFDDGEQSFRRYLKKAIASKYYLKNLLTDTAREEALKAIDRYNIKPGQSITGSSNVDQNQSSVTKPNDDTHNQQTTSKCNNGFVYVGDDNRCYSSSDTKSQINRCGSDEVDLDGDCGKAYPDTTCYSNITDYQFINGICVAKDSLHPKSIECPSGYDILFGNYSGQTFNGACYRYMSPNN